MKACTREYDARRRHACYRAWTRYHVRLGAEDYEDLNRGIAEGVFPRLEWSETCYAVEFRGKRMLAAVRKGQIATFLYWP